MPQKRSNLSTILIAILSTFLLASCVAPFRPPPLTSAEYCGIDPMSLAQPPQHKTVIEVWASAPRQHCLRAYAPWKVADEQPELEISVKVRAHNVNSTPYRDDLLAAAAMGKAPDISFVYHYHLPHLLKGDYLYPLEECRQQPGLRELPDELWTSLSPDGQAWGVPFEIEFVLLYYNKIMLRNLGWSEAAIEHLPKQIANGEFTLHDLKDIAEKAIERGVTRPGFAFIPHFGQEHTILDLYRAFGGRSYDRIQEHFVANEKAFQQTFAFLALLRRQNLFDPSFAIADFSDWGNTILLRDAVANGQVLFWHGYASDWQQMVMDYTDGAEEEAALRNTVGSALLPVNVRSQAGNALGTHINMYVILNEKATGRRNQLAACRLLAALFTTELPQHHADRTSQPVPNAFGFVLPSYWDDIGLQQLIWQPDHHPSYFGSYARIIVDMGVAVERGEMSAEEATHSTIQQLQEALGDQLVVE